MARPTYDPQNYLNEPGQGPLRPGGVEKPLSEAARSEADLPSTKSKAAKAQEADLEMCRDLEQGPSHVKNLGPRYLPRAPREEIQNYASRLERSVFFNVFGHTAKGLTGFVFRKDPKLGDDVPVKIRGDEDGKGGLWENVDNAGTHGDVFLRQLFYDALIAGHSAVLVEYPVTDGTQGFGEEGRFEVRPYLVPIQKENIISWRTTVENGRTLLTQVVIKECQMVPDGIFGEKEQVRYRVLYRDGVVGWKLLQETDRKQVILVDEGIYGNQTEIPLAEITTCGRKSMFESLPPLLDLAHINLAHYRQWSDYDTSLHMTCVPLLAESGVTDQYDTQGNKLPRVVGPNSLFSYADPNAKLYYVSHSGEALGSCKAALDDLMQAMANFGMAMMASEKRVAETEKSKMISKSGTDSQLAVNARGLQDGTEKILQYLANYLKEADGGSIEINRDFEEMLMDAPVMQAYAALVAAGFPKEIAVRMLKIGGRVPQDSDPEIIAGEWDAALQAIEDANKLAEEEKMAQILEAKKAA